MKIKHTSSYTCNKVSHQVDLKIGAIDKKVRKLKSMKQALISLSSNCNTNRPDNQDCPILEAFERHTEEY